MTTHSAAQAAITASYRRLFRDHWLPGAAPAGVGARTVFSRRQRWLLLAAFALLVIFHLPHAWLHGRFLDEEATVFLAYAWHRPWLDALFRPFGGYWNLAANATTLLVVELVKSNRLPLEWAPYCTMVMALAVQMLPAVLILTGRANWLAGRLAVIVALLIVAITPATEEVFFNVMHIQFHLALCAGLILALDVPPTRIARTGYVLLLFLAPLCGPAAIIILPLFVARAVLDRDFGRIKQFAALATGATIQLLLFYSASPMRSHPRDPAMIAAIMFTRLIMLPTLSIGKASRIGKAIYQSQMAGTTGWWWSVGVVVIFFGALIVVAARRRDAAIWLLLSGLAIATATYGLGMVIADRALLFSSGAGGRYNFLPLVLIGFALIALSMRQPSRGRPVYVAFCLLMLCNGAIRYFKSSTFCDGPSWPAEVAAWRRDHHHLLAVWPSPWAADLSDENPACSPIGRNLGQSNDPRYCESGWVASFYHAHPPTKP